MVNRGRVCIDISTPLVNLTLDSTYSGCDILVLSVIFTKKVKQICIFIGPSSYNCRALVSLSHLLLLLDALASLKTMLDIQVLRNSYCQDFKITEYYIVLQSITECYRVLQSVTECYRVLQSVSEYYKVLQRQI